MFLLLFSYTRGSGVSMKNSEVRGVRGRILSESDENSLTMSEANEFILPRDLWLLSVMKVTEKKCWILG